MLPRLSLAVTVTAKGTPGRPQAGAVKVSVVAAAARDADRAAAASSTGGSVCRGDGLIPRSDERESACENMDPAIARQKSIVGRQGHACAGVRCAEVHGPRIAREDISRNGISRDGEAGQLGPR